MSSRDIFHNDTTPSKTGQEKQGNLFETNSEREYLIQKHFNKSMYPMATIEKYSLKPQGKEWEV
jgi:hypothetical protein